MPYRRMVPFVEKNYNSVELGPRGTGKSFLFQQVSPYSHLASGGKASVATMFVNNASNQRRIVCQYDVVCFDEVSGISFDQKDGVNIMKGYMESGEFSRGKTPIRAEGSIVMVGNFDVDMQHQQRGFHLQRPLLRLAALGYKALLRTTGSACRRVRVAQRGHPDTPRAFGFQVLGLFWFGAASVFSLPPAAALRLRPRGGLPLPPRFLIF